MLSIVENGLIKVPNNQYADYNIVRPYNERRIDLDLPVRVYRNLHFKKKKIYSIVQNGLTVAHAERICIGDAKFVVNERGRQRVLRTKQKEFHAYIEGFYKTSGMGTTADRNDLPVTISYNPFTDSSFIGKAAATIFNPKGAWFVIIGEEIRASYTF